MLIPEYIKASRLAEIVKEFDNKAYIEMAYNITSAVRAVVYCKKNHVLYLTDDPQYVIDNIGWDLGCKSEDFEIYF